MKKINVVFLFSAFLLIATLGPMEAQSRFGVRAEVSYPDMRSETVFLALSKKQIDYVIDVESQTSTKSIGVWMQSKFGYLYFQPEILYSQFERRYDLSKNGEKSAVSGPKIERYKMIDIPVNAGLNFGVVRIGGGPITHILLESQSDFEFIPHLEVKNRRFSFGFQGGVGLDLGPVSLDLRYQTEFDRISDHLFYRAQRVRLAQRANKLNIGLGISF